MCGQLSEKLKRELGMAVRTLRGGGLVAFPTDTVYGLGADAFNPDAVARVFRVKRRPGHMPLPVLIGDMSQLDAVVRELPETAACAIRRFWPGALTLVLKRRPSVPAVLTAGSDTVAVRLPAHPVPVFLSRALGGPIVGTSANISGHPFCRTAEEVRRQLGGEVDLIIDGGEMRGTAESTVVDLTGGAPVVVREGALKGDEVVRTLQEVRRCE